MTGSEFQWKANEVVKSIERGEAKVVVIESSGIVRDNLFNIIELIDMAIKKVSELDEEEYMEIEGENE